jgi:hypothetical protein
MLHGWGGLCSEQLLHTLEVQVGSNTSHVSQLRISATQGPGNVLSAVDVLAAGSATRRSSGAIATRGTGHSIRRDQRCGGHSSSSSGEQRTEQRRACISVPVVLWFTVTAVTETR